MTDTDDIKTKCSSCKEPVSINATKCPHCGSKQITSKTAIGLIAFLGVVTLPLTYAGFTAAMGVSMGVVQGVYIGIGLVSPILFLVAFGAYKERREAIENSV